MQLDLLDEIFEQGLNRSFESSPLAHKIFSRMLLEPIELMSLPVFAVLQCVIEGVK